MVKSCKNVAVSQGHVGALSCLGTDVRGLLTLFSFIYGQVKIAPNKLASYTTRVGLGSWYGFNTKG